MAQIDLVEAAEATAMESAIVWQVQTILEALLPTGKLDAWLHGVGLAGAIGELKSEVERMETVVNGVKGRAVGNKPLARSLARVKELMYDADDVVDELDYCRLQQLVQGAAAIEQEGIVGDAAEQVGGASASTVAMLAPAIEPEGMVGDGAEQVDANIGYRNRDGAEQADASANNGGVVNSTGRKNRSIAWDHFRKTGDPTKAECIYCAAPIKVDNGRSGLHKHLKSCNKKRSAPEETRPSAVASVQNGAIISVNADSEGRKRIRTESNLATATHPWDRAKFSERISEIASELGSKRDDVIKYLKDSVDQYQSNTTSDTRVRTSGTLPGRVYGRYDEKDDIMSVIETANRSDNITVLPIVGIVGVGKTALAKLVYNDPLVKNQFERIWVWVSNIFDEVRVTREILDVVTLNSHEGSPRDRGSYEGVSNYTKLQEVLKNHMACRPKKFLLVLDDVNDCMDGSQWKDLLNALGSSCKKGNLIIVTARNLSIAQRLGTVEPVQLRALEEDDFKGLFKACAVDDNNYKEHLDYNEYLEIGCQIAKKLKGNPLAAESAAEMLREQPTLGHWKNIVRNGVWESLQLRGGIVTTLKIRYYQLPYQLQRCFLLCSIFPYNHRFHIDDLVSMWISLGFVKYIETGQEYFNVLVNSFLLEPVSLDSKGCYVMCGIMHEFARLVSKTDFAIIDGLVCEEVLPTVSHLSILTDSVHHKDGSVEFEEKLKSIASSARRLRTLILIGKYNSLFFRYFHTFMCNLDNCTHIRYLKLGNGWSYGEPSPISLSNFYHLAVLDLGCRAIVHDMSDLISMRHLVLINGARGASFPTRSACLQTMHLEDCGGQEILPYLESLSSLTKLKLRNMSEVTELTIPPLEELVLIDMPKLDRCSSSSVRDLNSSLRVLEIRRCRELKAFPLFEGCAKIGIEQKSWLPNISELTIHDCPHLVVSNPLPPSSRFCKLSIKKVSSLPNMEGSPDRKFKIGSLSEPSSIEFLDDKILSFQNLRTITGLEIVSFKNLFSFSLQGFRQLVCLKRMEIRDCAKIFSSDVPSSARTHEDMGAADFDALPSLERLSIVDCEITGEWLSLLLQHVRALEELLLHSCEQVTGLSIEEKENSFSNPTSAPRASSQGNPYRFGASTRQCPSKLLRIPSHLIPSLKKMRIINCELTFQGNNEGISRLTSLEELRIVDSPELISSLVHGDEIDDQANGRWLLPCSLGVLDIRGASLGTLQPCFQGDLTHLTVLQVWKISGLKSLRLHSCTALEKLEIGHCRSLDALEGFQSLRSLRHLKVCGCPGLPQCLKSLSTQGYEKLCPRLERLGIDDPSFLTTPFCKHLTSLQCLQLYVGYAYIDEARLTGEQEAALQLLTSLQQLRFACYLKLLDLPVGLHNLHSLKRLEIIYCRNISRLPERGLPPSLEELEVCNCSELLTEQCRMLATSKLKVIIDGDYVN